MIVNVVMSPPRCGSTVVAQLMRAAGLNVVKTHSYDETLLRNANGRVVFALRDPRDMCASAWRCSRGIMEPELRGGRRMTRGEMVEALALARATEREFARAYHGGWDLLEYERTRTISQLLEWLGVEVPEAESRFGLAANRARAEKLRDFDAVDALGIHGHHVLDGSVGTWRQCVRPEHHAWYSREILEPFKGWVPWVNRLPA